MQQFCHWHTKTVENPQGTDCGAHLCEGRIFACPYKTPTEAKRCSDYDPASLEDQPVEDPGWSPSKSEPSVPLSAIQALVQQWEQELRVRDMHEADSYAAGWNDALGRHIDQLSALCVEA